MIGIKENSTKPLDWIYIKKVIAWGSESDLFV